MKRVAFFRNVNLGQGRSPTKPQLEAAFLAAGAALPQSFQTNGTVVFVADDARAAEAIVGRACALLREMTGLSEPAYVVDLPHLAALVENDPFAGIDREGVFDFSATFLPSAALAKLRAPLASPRGDLEIVRVTEYVALSVSRRVGVSIGNATLFLEKMLGVPATTRGWGTITRLVRKAHLSGNSCVG